MSVPVSVILDRKGSNVATIAPDASVAEAAEAMVAHNVGALVVSVDGQTPSGVISERDVVRAIPTLGAQCLERQVRDLMTTELTTCIRETTVDELMTTMTEQRIRHVPVIDGDGKLVGIVSIGDVVKHRLSELEIEAQSLEQYVTGTRP